MPDFFIDACPNCAVCNSDIRVVRNRHHTPSGFANQKGDVPYQDVPFKTEMEFLRNTCRMPGKDLNKLDICASEFRYASMLSFGVNVGNTTFHTYSKSTDGSVCITVCADTVNNEIGTGDKYYAFSRDDGKTFDIASANTNTKNFGSLRAGRYSICVRDQTVTRAGCSRSTVAGTMVTVGNGGGGSGASNAQGAGATYSGRPGYDDTEQVYGCASD